MITKLCGEEEEPPEAARMIWRVIIKLDANGKEHISKRAKEDKKKAKKKATKNPNWKEKESILQCKLKRVVGTKERTHTVWNKLGSCKKQYENRKLPITCDIWQMVKRPQQSHQSPQAYCY